MVALLSNAHRTEQTDMVVETKSTAYIVKNIIEDGSLLITWLMNMLAQQ